MEATIDFDQTQVVDVDDLEDDDITYEFTSSGEKVPSACLRILSQKGLRETSYPLYEGDNIIGRQGSTCHVTIPLNSLSKEHACIQIIEDSHLIFDKSSRNKTRRGKLVLRPEVRYELRHGDTITFADVRCVYEIPEQSSSGRDGNKSDAQQTLVLSESDTEDDDIQKSHARAMQQTLVFEVSDEDSSTDLMEGATQAYTETEIRDENGKNIRSLKVGHDSHRISRKHLREPDRRYQKFGMAVTSNQRGSHSSREANTESPRHNDEVSEDEVGLFAVSTLAWDVSDDVVHVDDEDTDKGSTKVVEVVTDYVEAGSPGTVAVHPDATVAVEEHARIIDKKADVRFSARSLRASAKAPTLALTETLATEATVTGLGKENCGSEDNRDVPTQVFEETFIFGKAGSEKVTRTPRNRQGRKDQAEDGHSNEATVFIDDSLPEIRKSAIRGRSRGLQPVVSHVPPGISNEPTQTLIMDNESSNKSWIIDKCEKSDLYSKPHIRRNRSSGATERSKKSDKTDLTQISIIEDGNNTQPYDTDHSHTMLDAPVECPQVYGAGHAGATTVSIDGIEGTEKYGRTEGKQQIGGATDPTLRYVMEEEPQGSSIVAAGVKRRIDGVSKTDLGSSDDSDLEEVSVLKSNHGHPDDMSQLSECGSTNNGALTVNIEPTLSYEMAVNRDPKSANGMVMDSDPTLAYDLAVEKEPRKTRNRRLSNIKRQQGTKQGSDRKPDADKTPDSGAKTESDRKPSSGRKSHGNIKPVGDNIRPDSSSKTDEMVPGDLQDGEKPGIDMINSSNTSLASRSPLKSAIANRRGYQSEVHKHVAFAETRNEENEDRLVEAGASLKVPRHLASPEPNVANSSTRLGRTRSKNAFAQPSDTKHRERSKTLRADEGKAEPSTNDNKELEEKKECLLENLEEESSKNNQVMVTGTAHRAAKIQRGDSHAAEIVTVVPNIEETHKQIAGIKKRIALGNDQEAINGVTVRKEGFAHPSSKRGRVSAVVRGQEVVGVTDTMRDSTRLTGRISNQQQRSTRQTRRNTDLITEKKGADVPESDETGSVTSTLGDSESNAGEKLKVGVMAEVTSYKRSNNKVDQKKEVEDSTALVAAFVSSSETPAQPDLHLKDFVADRKVVRQQRSTSVAHIEETLRGKTRSSKETEVITEVQDSGKGSKINEDSELADSECDSSHLPVTDRSRQPVGMLTTCRKTLTVSSSHIMKSVSSGEEDVLSKEIDQGKVMAGRATRRGTGKSILSKQTERKEKSFSDMQNRFQAENSLTGHGVDLVSNGRGKKRKTYVVSDTESNNKPVTERSQVSGKLGKRGRNATTLQVTSTLAAGLPCESGIIASPSHTSTVSSINNPPSSSPASTSSSAISQAHASTRRPIRARSKKTEIEEPLLTDMDSEKPEWGQNSSQLSKRRRKTSTNEDQDYNQPGTNRQDHTQMSPVKKARKMSIPKLPFGKKTHAEDLISSALHKSSVSCKPKVMLTGYADELAEKVVRDLGGDMVTSIQECTHLVTDRICRTVKFLSGLAKGLLIVSPQWLESCRKAGTFVDGHNFLVSDSAVEKQYKFNLATSLRQAQIRPLFTGYKIHVTKSVRPDPPQMQEILKFAGAEYLRTMPSKSQDNTVVISCLEDHKICQPAIKAGIPIVGVEFILTGILRQEPDIESFLLLQDGDLSQMPGTSKSRRK